MIYLDNAATTFPKPLSVSQAVKKAVDVYGGNPGRSGHKLSMEAAKQVFECREEAAELFGVPGPEFVMFASNCTQALNMAIWGVQGGHMLITCNEHNSVLRPVHAATKGNYSIIEVFEGDPLRTLEDTLRKITPDTTAAVLTHSSNVTGVVTPVEILAPELKKRGITVIVDAAQSAGVLDIAKMADCVDIVCAPGHKGLYGPTGTGLLLRYSDIGIRPILYGGTGSQSLLPDQPEFYPDRLEAGTVNSVGIIGLREGVRFVKTRGREEIYAHELSMVQLAYGMLSETKGVALYTGYPQKGSHVPVLCFNVKDRHSEEVMAILDKNNIAVRSGYHCASLTHKHLGTLETGAVRVSPSVFTKRQDIEMLWQIVKKI